MPIRYTDSTAHKDMPSDFAPRGRKPTIFGLTVIFLLAIGLSVTLPVLMLDKMALVFWLCLLLASTGWYVLLSMTQSRDLVLATEFQNALFASALGYSNKFCLIVKREGSIIYTDRGFQAMFPELIKARNVTLVGMMKYGRVAAADKEKIYAAIDRGTYEKVVFDIYGGDNKINKIVLSIEPIARPSGFLLLRAREYVEERSRKKDDSKGTPIPVMENPLLTKFNLDQLTDVMNRMNTGIYLTDPAGVIMYANPLIEQWLAYGVGEMAGKNVTLQDIVHQSDSATTITPGNFEGEFNLKTKQNGVIKTFINQKAIQGDNQQLLGCIALVHIISGQDSGTKAALW